MPKQNFGIKNKKTKKGSLCLPRFQLEARKQRDRGAQAAFKSGFSSLKIEQDTQTTSLCAHTRHITFAITTYCLPREHRWTGSDYRQQRRCLCKPASLVFWSGLASCVHVHVCVCLCVYVRVCVCLCGRSKVFATNTYHRWLRCTCRSI